MRSTINRPRSLAFVALAGLALVAAACSSSGGASAAPSAAPSSAVGGAVTVKCAATWPPFVVASGAPTAGTGVTGALTTFARADGAMQVAINGLPLYYYAADTKAGDTTGQGVGGKWFVASPTGAAPLAVPSSAPSAGPSIGGGKYSY